MPKSLKLLFFFWSMWRQGFFFRILWCSQNGNCPENSLVKFGYILYMKVANFLNHSTLFGYQPEKRKFSKIAKCFFFTPRHKLMKLLRHLGAILPKRTRHKKFQTSHSKNLISYMAFFSPLYTSLCNRTPICLCILYIILRVELLMEF